MSRKYFKMFVKLSEGSLSVLESERGEEGENRRIWQGPTSGDLKQMDGWKRTLGSISLSSSLTHTLTYAHANTHIHTQSVVSPWLSLPRWNLLSDVTWAGGLLIFPDQNLPGHFSYSVQLQPDAKISSSLSAESFRQVHQGRIESRTRRLHVPSWSTGLFRLLKQCFSPV